MPAHALVAASGATAAREQSRAEQSRPQVADEGQFGAVLERHAIQ